MATEGQDGSDRLGGEETKPVGAASRSSPDGANVPLFDASKMGFNDRAWNDPPSLLLNTGAGVGGSNLRPKLTSRVAFPLNFAQQQAAAPPPTHLNPNAPPPMTGFVKCEDTSKTSSETDKTELE